jgi:hypothetical protein
MLPLASLIPSYNLFWIALLVLASIESVVALVGTNVFQKRHHGGLRFANDILARLQFAFATVFVAVLINGAFSQEQQPMKGFVAIMFFVALASYLIGLKFAAPTHYDSVFKKLNHSCPTSVDEECTRRLGFWTYVRLISVNVLLCIVSLTGGFIILLSLKPASSITAAIVRIEPQGVPTVRGVPYNGQPDWYSDHTFWLEQEGDRDKKQGVVKGYEVGEAKYTTTSATDAFHVILEVPDTYEIASHSVFRLTTSGDREFFERIEPIPEEDFRRLNVSIPECNKGDKIIVLFRVESKVSGAPLDVASIVKAYLR